MPGALEEILKLLEQLGISISTKKRYSHKKKTSVSGQSLNQRTFALGFYLFRPNSS